jgi:hypothetical protein
VNRVQNIRRYVTRRAKSRMRPSPNNFSSRCPFTNTYISSSEAETQFSPATYSGTFWAYSATLTFVSSKNKDSTFRRVLATFSGAATITLLSGHLRLSFACCLAV